MVLKNAMSFFRTVFFRVQINTRIKYMSAIFKKLSFIQNLSLLKQKSCF